MNDRYWSHWSHERQQISCRSWLQYLSLFMAPVYSPVALVVVVAPVAPVSSIVCRLLVAPVALVVVVVAPPVSSVCCCSCLWL